MLKEAALDIGNMIFQVSRPGAPSAGIKCGKATIRRPYDDLSPCLFRCVAEADGAYILHIIPVPGLFDLLLRQPQEYGERLKILAMSQLFLCLLKGHQFSGVQTDHIREQILLVFIKFKMEQLRLFQPVIVSANSFRNTPAQAYMHGTDTLVFIADQQFRRAIVVNIGNSDVEGAISVIMPPDKLALRTQNIDAFIFTACNNFFLPIAINVSSVQSEQAICKVFILPFPCELAIATGQRNQILVIGREQYFGFLVLIDILDNNGANGMTESIAGKLLPLQIEDIQVAIDRAEENFILPITVEVAGKNAAHMTPGCILPELFACAQIESINAAIFRAENDAGLP